MSVSLELVKDNRYADKYCLYLRDFAGPGASEYQLIWRGNMEVAWQLSKLRCVDVDVVFPSEVMRWSSDDSVDARTLIIETSPIFENDKPRLKIELSFTDRQPVIIDLWTGDFDVAEDIFRVASTYAEIQRKQSIPPSSYELLLDNLISVERKISWLFVMKQRKPMGIDMSHGRLSEDQIKKLKIVGNLIPSFQNKINRILDNDQAYIEDKPGKALTIIMSCNNSFKESFMPKQVVDNAQSRTSISGHHLGGFPAKPNRGGPANKEHDDTQRSRSRRTGASSHNVKKKSR